MSAPLLELPVLVVVPLEPEVEALLEAEFPALVEVPLEPEVEALREAELPALVEVDPLEVAVPVELDPLEVAVPMEVDPLACSLLPVPAELIDIKLPLEVTPEVEPVEVELPEPPETDAEPLAWSRAVLSGAMSSHPLSITTATAASRPGITVPFFKRRPGYPFRRGGASPSLPDCKTSVRGASLSLPDCKTSVPSNRVWTGSMRGWKPSNRGRTGCHPGEEAELTMLPNAGDPGRGQGRGGRMGS